MTPGVGALKSAAPRSDAARMGNEGLALLVTIASACRIAGLTWVGGRMLWLARRTGSLPELLLGTSFLSFCTVGVPLLTFSGFTAERVADVDLPLLAGALFLLDFGTLCFAAFVRCVFRPRATLATLALAAAGITLAVHVVLTPRAIAGASPGSSPTEAIGGLALLLAGVMSASFAWGTAEAFSYWDRLRRQQGLGLADGAAVRRMGLFALGCAAQLAMMGFNALATLRGTNPLADPLPALGIAATSLATGVAFALAFGAPASRPSVATA